MNDKTYTIETKVLNDPDIQINIDQYMNHYYADRSPEDRAELREFVERDFLFASPNATAKEKYEFVKSHNLFLGMYVSN